MPDRATVQIATETHRELQLMTYEMSSRTKRRTTQNDVIAAALTLANEQLDRMASILNDMRGMRE